MSAPGDAATAGGEDGFALMEVLVAFAILALASLAMLRSFGGTIAVVSAVETRTARSKVAQDLLEMFRARPSLSAGREDGVLDDFAWRVEILEIEGPGPRAAGSVRPVRLDVVLAPGRGQPISNGREELRTVVLVHDGHG